MTFPLGEWVYGPTDRISKGSDDLGGIWVAQNLSNAKGLVRYMKKKAKKENKPYLSEVRLFECEIGEILYQNSYRVKTDKVKMTREVDI